MRFVITLFFCLALLLSGPAIAQQEAGETAQEHLYRVGPGDKLGVQVWKDEYHSRELVVQPDGYITFPLAGDILAMGRTLPQIREDITTRIREYLPDARIIVILEEANSYRIYVLGKVNNSGEYRSSRPVNVLQALAMAGGFDNLAINNPGNIKVIRSTAAGQEVIRFDYDKVKKGKSLQMNVLLNSGDVVIVP